MYLNMKELHNLMSQEKPLKTLSIPVKFRQYLRLRNICIYEHFCHSSSHCNALLSNEKYLKITFQQNTS